MKKARLIYICVLVLVLMFAEPSVSVEDSAVNSDNGVQHVEVKNEAEQQLFVDVAVGFVEIEFVV
uniref:Uncharacterized protein n=1 Tax=Arion vulgaris TaxID=1028688 RepID=A0A0B7BC36_9EUPU